MIQGEAKSRRIESGPSQPPSVTRLPQKILETPRHTRSKILGMHITRNRNVSHVHHKRSKRLRTPTAKAWHAPPTHTRPRLSVRACLCVLSLFSHQNFGGPVRRRRIPCLASFSTCPTETMVSSADPPRLLTTAVHVVNSHDRGSEQKPTLMSVFRRATSSRNREKNSSPARYGVDGNSFTGVRTTETNTAAHGLSLEIPHRHNHKGIAAAFVVVVAFYSKMATFTVQYWTPQMRAFPIFTLHCSRQRQSTKREGESGKPTKWFSR